MIEIVKIERVGKGALVAKFAVKMHKWGGIVIRDCTLFESGDKRWMNFPSKEYEADGKKKYMSFVYYEDRELDNKLKDAIRDAAFAALPSKEPEVSQDFEEVPF